MKTATRGNEAEAKILAALIERGFEVLVPFGGGQPYDLVIDLGGFDLLKVQCKTGWDVNGCIVFHTTSTDHGQGRRPYLGLAHIFGVYFPPRQTIYLLPLDAVAGSLGRLRLEPTRNNQKRGVRFASDFEINRWGFNSLREVKEKVLLAPEPELNFA
jgi:PD-(D/E)XK endonuclease